MNDLTNREIQRYSRQLILPEFGVQPQQLLKQAKVCIVGAGGLGCPVTMYLAGAGIGELTIIDFDTVSISNLHRQVAYRTDTVHTRKVDAMKMAVQALNPLVRCATIHVRMDSSNVKSLIDGHTVVVDCCDNAETRYIVNAACGRLSIPLVSASALGMEGTVAIFHGPKMGSCYRCLYPNVLSQSDTCTENGVLGVVPGVIGTMAAVETIKLCSNVGNTIEGYQCLYSALDGTWMRIKLPPARIDCIDCGRPNIDRKNRVRGAYCYPSVDDQVPGVTVEEYFKVRSSKVPHVLLDVRNDTQYKICALSNAMHTPLEFIQVHPKWAFQFSLKVHPLYVICRTGKDSKLATRILMDHGVKNVYSVDGGLLAWSQKIDVQFPMY